jgi:hypothetical protein
MGSELYGGNWAGRRQMEWKTMWVWGGGAVLAANCTRGYSKPGKKVSWMAEKKHKMSKDGQTRWQEEPQKMDYACRMNVRGPQQIRYGHYRKMWWKTEGLCVRRFGQVCTETWKTRGVKGDARNGVNVTDSKKAGTWNVRGQRSLSPVFRKKLQYSIVPGTR